jgi:hypothetical protein
MQRPRLLASILDPGWLYLVAGLALCAAAILVPAQHDLTELEGMLARLHHEEDVLAGRLRAHADLLDDLDQLDPALVRRLAASQLNLVTAAERPAILARLSPDATSVIDTIDRAANDRLGADPAAGAGTGSVPAAVPGAAPPPPTSRLMRLTTGRNRLWMIAGAMLCIFVGMLIGPGPTRRGAVASDTPDPIGDTGDETAMSETNVVVREPAVDELHLEHPVMTVVLDEDDGDHDARLEEGLADDSPEALALADDDDDDDEYDDDVEVEVEDEDEAEDEDEDEDEAEDEDEDEDGEYEFEIEIELEDDEEEEDDGGEDEDADEDEEYEYEYEDEDEDEDDDEGDEEEPPEDDDEEYEYEEEDDEEEDDEEDGDEDDEDDDDEDDDEDDDDDDEYEYEYVDEEEEEEEEDED